MCRPSFRLLLLSQFILASSGELEVPYCHAAAARLLAFLCPSCASIVDLKITTCEAELQQQKPATLLHQHGLDQDNGVGGLAGSPGLGGGGFFAIEKVSVGTSEHMITAMPLN